MMISRFAPSPTGRLHIGHAYSALFAAHQARKESGTFILRIEDIDTERCRPEYEEGIYEDLSWLGLSWAPEIRRQTDHFQDYEDALLKLKGLGVLYPCFCSRKDIRKEIKRSASGPHGPEGPHYPGTCRHLDKTAQEDKIAERQERDAGYSLRLDIEKALKHLKAPLTWHDRDKGKQEAMPGILGDVILARRDTPASYHLCVTLDDHIQNITLVARGEDLFPSTHIHRLLQDLLELNIPEWHHHKLLLDENGKRFAKRDNAITLQHLREHDGKTPQDIIDFIGPLP